jgi:TetR/AcrR family transcriptional regulator
MRGLLKAILPKKRGSRYTVRYVESGGNGYHRSPSTERILDHALKLFSTKGYDATSVREICEGAGITKLTLYHFFGSKEGVYRPSSTVRSKICAAASPSSSRHPDAPRTG